MAEREKLIELKDLQITFGSGKKKFVAVDHVNFDIYKGETFSLVGESGSGKTTIGRAICRINPTSGGDIFFKGQKINGKISKELDQEVIRKIQMIFQDPMASLNERAKVEYIVAEGLLNHHLYKTRKTCTTRSWMRCTKSACCRSSLPASRTSSPAASVSASASPVLWSCSRSSSWPMSPSRLWTSPSAHRC